MLACPIPKTVIVCPYCGGQLHLEVDEWDTKTRVPTEAGVHLSCEHETPNGPDHTEMPYVYWLPAQRTVYAWIVETGLTVEWPPVAQQLADWNAGQPITKEV